MTQDDRAAGRNAYTQARQEYDAQTPDWQEGWQHQAGWQAYYDMRNSPQAHLCWQRGWTEASRFASIHDKWTSENE